MRRLWLAVLLCAGVAFLPACDRNTEPFVEGEKPRAPDLARIFPESDPSVPRPGVAPPLPSAPQRGAPPVRRQAASSAAAGAISGTISVAPEVQGSQPAQGLLFVIARAAGVRAGPPMAVLRIPNPSFPLEFEIGPENVMIPSMRFEGEIDITARLDGDGNAMTRQPGDLSGSSVKPHGPGTTGVRIALDQKL